MRVVCGDNKLVPRSVRRKRCRDGELVANIAVDPQLGMSRPIHLQIANEWWIGQMREPRAIAFRRRERLSVDRDLQAVAIGENCGILSRSGGRFLTEVPIKIRGNDG